MKKILTIISTRPEIIRLSRIIFKLDKFCRHVLVYTGQNFDPKLSNIFFDELGIKKPDYYLGNKSRCFGEQVGLIFTRIEEILKKEKPDKILILGDTNGCLCTIVAKRLKIPIFHLEAGNSCGDWIDEEVNRFVVDSISDIHLPYTQLSKENLIRKGIPNNRIFVMGNPIGEVLHYYSNSINKSSILEELNLSKQKYILATFHRNENVTDSFILKHLIRGLELISDKFGCKIICPLHPKTITNLELFKIKVNNPDNILLVSPLGLFDFVKLEQNALCLISDSGTVPEEGTLFRIPSVIIREKMERPELLQCGSTILSGTYSENILEAVNLALSCDKYWNIPVEYLQLDVSDRVVKLLLGNT